MSLNTILATAPLTSTGFHLKANGTTLGNSLIWDNGTNVGIGNTNTSYTLDVSGTGRFSSNVNIDGEYLTIGGATNNAVINNIASFRFNLDCDNTGTGESFTVGHNQTIINDSNVLFRIQDNGNVGIGTSSPTRNLVVQSSSTISLISIVSNPASIAYLLLGDTNADAQGRIQYDNGSDIMQIYSNGAEAIRILSNQNVGIGTGGDANYRLYVKGVDTGTSNWAILVQNNADTQLFRIRNDGLFGTGTAAASPYNNTYGNAANVYIGSDGFMGRSTSSLKYKENVQDYTKGLAEVMQLRAVTYTSKNPSEEGQTFAGLIAEEVHNLGLTEFVQYAEDGTPDALAYANMIALLTKAIQQQQIQIQNLQEQINILAK